MLLPTISRAGNKAIVDDTYAYAHFSEQMDQLESENLKFKFTLIQTGKKLGRGKHLS